MTTTTVQDDTVRTVRTYRTLDDRADMLRRLAERWDENIFHFDRRRATDPRLAGMSDDQVVMGLTLAAAEYAAPDLPLHEIRYGMEELRNLIGDLRNYECEGVWDGDPDWTDDMVLARLNGDIDDALFPLLTGQPILSACWECRRVKAKVSDWAVREPNSVMCGAHQ